MVLAVLVRRELPILGRQILGHPVKERLWLNIHNICLFWHLHLLSVEFQCLKVSAHQVSQTHCRLHHPQIFS